MNLHEQISKVAYELYEKNGKVEDRDLDNWLEAERIVMAQYKEQEKLETELSSSPKKKKSSTTKKASKIETKARKTKE